MARGIEIQEGQQSQNYQIEIIHPLAQAGEPRI